MQHENRPAPDKIEITPELTIPKLFYQQATRYGDNKVAMREKEFGIWQSVSWRQYLEHVRDFSLGLIWCKFQRV